MSMNVHLAKQGDKVRFTGHGGYDGDKQYANKHLKKGGIYTIDSVQLYQSSTDVFLKEVPGQSFNSVHFDDYSVIDYWRIEELTSPEFTEYFRERMVSLQLLREVLRCNITVDDFDAPDDEAPTIVIDILTPGILWIFYYSTDLGKWDEAIINESMIQRYNRMVTGGDPGPMGIYSYDQS
jgi:hypothetical protein